jgi:hypothetical protein
VKSRKPELAVAIPVRNGENSVVRFLRSFETDLFPHRFGKIHLEVIDDRSTDKTFEILQSYVPSTDFVSVKISSNARRLGQHQTLLKACTQIPNGFDFYATTAGDGDEPSGFVAEAYDTLVTSTGLDAVCGVLPQAPSSILKPPTGSIAWGIFLKNYPLFAGKRLAATHVFRGDTWKVFVAHFRVFGFPSIALGEMDPGVGFVEIRKESGRPSNYSPRKRMILFLKLLRANDLLVARFGVWLAVLGGSISAIIALYLATAIFTQPDRPEGWLLVSALIVGLSGVTFAVFGGIFHLLSRVHHSVKKIQIEMDLRKTDKLPS